jgi:hypothetical protein
MTKLVGIVLCLCVLCTTTFAQEEERDSSFKIRMMQIEDQIVDLTSEFDVFRSARFEEVWNKPLKFKKAVIHFLRYEVGTNTQRRIAILSMQNMSLTDYLSFCNDVFAIWKEHRITDDILVQAILPGYDWNTKFQDNYRKPAVRNLLMSIKNYRPEPRVQYRNTPMSFYIDHILAGKATAELEMLRRDGQIETPSETIRRMKKIRAQQQNRGDR